MRLRGPIAQEFDRTCAVYFREWEEARETNRLKRVLNWFMGGEEETPLPSLKPGGFEHLRAQATDEHGEIDLTRLQRKPARVKRANG